MGMGVIYFLHIFCGRECAKHTIRGGYMLMRGVSSGCQFGSYTAITMELYVWQVLVVLISANDKDEQSPPQATHFY